MKPIKAPSHHFSAAMGARKVWHESFASDLIINVILNRSYEKEVYQVVSAPLHPHHLIPFFDKLQKSRP
jgi:hypothetical protein